MKQNESYFDEKIYFSKQSEFYTKVEEIFGQEMFENTIFRQIMWLLWVEIRDMYGYGTCEDIPKDNLYVRIILY